MTDQTQDAAPAKAEAPAAKTELPPAKAEAPTPKIDAPAPEAPKDARKAEAAGRQAAEKAAPLTTMARVRTMSRATTSPPRIDAPRAAQAEPATADPAAPAIPAPVRDTRRLMLAASLVLGVAVGGLGGAGATLLAQRGGPSAADWHRIAARLDGGSEAGRLGAELKAMKDGLASLKESADRGRSDAGVRFAQMGERFERLQKAEQEVGNRVSALSERIERADRDETARLAALGDRIEKRLAAPQAAQAAAKPAEPTQTGSIATTADAKPAGGVVAGWTLREVYDGVAMLENRNQRLLEVTPGATIPGIGRVEAIERRGRSWVVVTAKGLITSQAW